MMRRYLSVAGALAIITTGPAIAADNLDCMNFADGSAGAIATGAFVENFTMAQFDTDGPPDELSMAVAEQALTCGDENGWSEAAIEYAVLQQIAEIGERAIRSNYPRIGATVDRIDAALSPKEQARLWSIVDGMAQFEAEEDFDAGDYYFIGLMVNKLEPGISAADSENVGSLLAMMAINRHARADFEAN